MKKTHETLGESAGPYAWSSFAATSIRGKGYPPDACARHEEKNDVIKACVVMI
jgi:hypothetical protein